MAHALNSWKCISQYIVCLVGLVFSPSILQSMWNYIKQILLIFFLFGMLLMTIFYFTGTLIKPEANYKLGRFFSLFHKDYCIVFRLSTDKIGKYYIWFFIFQTINSPMMDGLYMKISSTISAKNMSIWKKHGEFVRKTSPILLSLRKKAKDDFCGNT